MENPLLTEEQKKQIVYHFRMAAWHRCQQWNHEDAVEKILGFELSGFDTENLAVCMGETEPKLDDAPEDCEITWEGDLEHMIIEEWPDQEN